MFAYIADGGFRMTAARAGTEQANTRPVSLVGVNVIRHTLSDAELSAYSAIAADDPEQLLIQQRAFLAALPRKSASKSGKVQVTTDALAQWRKSIPGDTATERRENAQSILASGVVFIAESDPDNTETVLADLFPEEEPAVKSAK